jgi:hypothetical protein
MNVRESTEPFGSLLLDFRWAKVLSSELLDRRCVDFEHFFVCPFLLERLLEVDEVVSLERLSFPNDQEFQRRRAES